MYKLKKDQNVLFKIKDHFATHSGSPLKYRPGTRKMNPLKRKMQSISTMRPFIQIRKIRTHSQQYHILFMDV